MSTDAEILFKEEMGEGGALGIITLNRPAALNSLNHTMIQELTATLMRWATADKIKAVYIQAIEGKAFCAGGDIRLTYDRMKANDARMVEFFREEYQLNRLIFHYPKPYIAMLNGITMGGGVGISIHGSHRIATEKLTFAMPETGIGFFPDVGGTYFLPRLKGRLGFYLGLTGARLQRDDCFQLGITTHSISSDNQAEILARLINTPFSDQPKKFVSALLQPFHLLPLSTPLMEQQTEIDFCFSHETIESILDSLRQSKSSICNAAFELLAKKSPASLKITLLALLAGEQMDFDACMQQEYRLVNRFLTSEDFLEGIRAVIVDKDQQPKWHPVLLSQVMKKWWQIIFNR